MSTVDAMEQARLVRDGVQSSQDLVTAALERIARLDPDLNAVIHRRDDRARAEAERCDAATAEERTRPFHGVPIVLKDTEGSAMAGEPLTLGTRVLRDAEWRARADTPLTRRIRDAGFVVVGRTNVPELCASGTTEPLAFGPTRNPWDHARSPGGSSGGSAAAVAAGMVAIAHGSDGGGSVREPASLCGVVGLMPSRGRISAAPAGAPWGGFSNDGVIARTVRDVAAGHRRHGGERAGRPVPRAALARTARRGGRARTGCVPHRAAAPRRG